MNNLKDIAKQIADLINKEAKDGRMLPKTDDEIEKLIGTGRGFWILENEELVSFAAIFLWPKYIEIGSVITAKKYRGRGYGSALVEQAIDIAKEMTGKPIIALTNQESTHIFERAGFEYKNNNPTGSIFWEPCKQTCVDFGRWPKCNCSFMELERLN